MRIRDRNHIFELQILTVLRIILVLLTPCNSMQRDEQDRYLLLIRSGRLTAQLMDYHIANVMGSYSVDSRIFQAKQQLFSENNCDDDRKGKPCHMSCNGLSFSYKLFLVDAVLLK